MDSQFRFGINIIHIFADLFILKLCYIVYLFCFTGTYKLMNENAFDIHPIRADKPEECLLLQQRYVL